MRIFGSGTVLLIVLTALPPAAPGGEPGDLIATIPAGFNAPGDLAYDEDEGTYWTISYTKAPVFVRSHDLKTASPNIPLPIVGNEFTSGNTGIAFDSREHTFWIANNFFLAQIYEVDRTGTATGRVIYPPAPKEQAGCAGLPGIAVLGLTYDPQGDSLSGSIYAVMSYNGVSLIYEMGLSGDLLRSFPDLADPNRFIGMDCNGGIGDIDLIREGGKLVGFYVSATWGGLPYTAMRLDLEGKYTGVSVSLASVGGIVGGLLHRPFPDPVTGEEKDSLVTTASNYSRFVVLEGGEPKFSDVTNLQCAASGRRITLTWARGQEYDSIEVLRGCDVMQVLSGTSDGWEVDLEDGVYQISLRALRGLEFQETGSCAAVVGAGQVLQSANLGVRDDGYARVMDLGWDGAEQLVVTDSLNRRLLFYDLDLQPLGYYFFLDESFFAFDDRIGGVAYGGEPGTVFVYNKTKARMARMETSGMILGTFDVAIPQSPKDIEKGRDSRDVGGLTYDPHGDHGMGSLWLVEDGRGYLYELDLQGTIIRELPHPYLQDPTLWALGGPSGTAISGIEAIPGTDPTQVYLSGVIDEPLAQCGIGQQAPLIFRFDLQTGKMVPGSKIPQDGLGDRWCIMPLAFQCVPKDGETRLYAIHGYAGELVRLETRSPLVFPPEFLSAQASKAGDVEIRFTDGEAYDQVEIFRDCAPLSTLPGDASSFVDQRPGSGYHRYEVRGQKGGSVSESRRAGVRVGPGAILQRVSDWPTRDAWQISRDPVDGTFYGTYSYQDQIHHFDRDLKYLDGFKVALDSPWECRTLAVRVVQGDERLIYYIAAPGLNGTTFRLMAEKPGGGLVSQVEISPPFQPGLIFRQPWGLAWDPASDTFYYQEKNSNTFVQLGSSGNTLRTFPHPAPPVNFYVDDIGITVAPSRGTLFITSADILDQSISKVLEMRPDGTLTGYQIPIPRSETGFVVQGIAFIEPDELIVTQGASMMRVQAFESGFQPTFVRGNANGDLLVDISDVVFLLAAFYTGGPMPECAKAADVDDSGVLDITDAIYELNFLFQGGADIPPPFPDRGIDPTPDLLPCR